MKKLFLYILLLFITSGNIFSKDMIRADIAHDNIKIRTSFSGAEIFIYGAIDFELFTDSSLLIEVKGPNKDYTVRKKQRKFGIWFPENKKINFTNIPSYYAVISSGNLNGLIYKNFYRDRKILWENLRSRPNSLIFNEYNDYYIALKNKLTTNGLFYENSDSIEILNNKLFKAIFKLPAITPTGTYLINVFLLDADGTLIDEINSSIEVEKGGLIEKLFNYSKNQSLLYGVLAALGALIAGFMASEIFRRI